VGYIVVGLASFIPVGGLVLLHRWAFGLEAGLLARGSRTWLACTMGSSLFGLFYALMLVPVSPAGALIMSQFLGLTLVALAWSQWSFAGRLRRLCDRARRSEPAARPALLAALHAIDARPDGLRGAYLLSGAAALAAAGDWSEAGEWRRRVDPAQLDRRFRTVYWHLAALEGLAAGDYGAARQALAAAPRPGPSKAWDDALDQTHALLLTVEGRPAVALRLARGREPRSDRRTGWRVVEAHALAATGDHDAAREICRALRETDTGLAEIDLTSELDLPASSVARALVLGGSPFR
jgi:hypothetical protein